MCKLKFLSLIVPQYSGRIVEQKSNSDGMRVFLRVELKNRELYAKKN
jgi:hypothetical protein